ncbi:MAG: energy transducer TonB [Flavobacteriales bacterium]
MRRILRPLPTMGLCALLLVGCKGGSSTVTTAPGDCCQRERDIYEVPELTKAPEFPGGEPAMYAWLGNTLAHPTSAEGVEGTTWVQFNVACDGKLQNIIVKMALHPDLDSAAVRAVRDMPVWTPGKIKDRIVCTRYALPVRFE